MEGCPVYFYLPGYSSGAQNGALLGPRPALVAAQTGLQAIRLAIVSLKKRDSQPIDNRQLFIFCISAVDFKTSSHGNEI